MRNEQKKPWVDGPMVGCFWGSQSSLGRLSESGSIFPTESYKEETTHMLMLNECAHDTYVGIVLFHLMPSDECVTSGLSKRASVLSTHQAQSLACCL